MNIPKLNADEKDIDINFAEHCALKYFTSYGTWVLPTLKSQLLNKQDIIRQRASFALCTYLVNPLNIVNAVNHDLLPILKKCLKDQDDIVRYKCSEALKIIISSSIGRKQLFYTENVIEDILLLIKDPKKNIQLMALTIIEIICYTTSGLEDNIYEKISSALVKTLEKREINIELMISILNILNECYTIIVEHINLYNVIEIFLPLLHHNHLKVKEKAALIFFHLFQTYETRNVLPYYKCLPALMNLLNETNLDVQKNVCLAVAAATISTEGKHIAFKNNLMGKIIPLLNEWRCSDIQLSAIKIITNLHEYFDENNMDKNEILSLLKFFLQLTTHPSLSRHAYLLLHILENK